ncbi:chromosome segregation protein SMC [Rhodobacteraceae bacterium KMM 6894]|nr:chromosome segregation protein SMC [Rhodobacteraceae bacterium KMM 6894]
MKLLALHLGNVRKFTGKRASITGIGDGITVVSEANEFGKSTFFDAIHALFFEKYSSSAKPLKSLQPYAGGAVEVAADVQTEAGLFRVEKRFLARKSAKVSRLDDGTTIAQDDEAERWIADLLGGAGDGPAGLLWVRQGLVGLEPDSARDKAQGLETRRDLLSSVAGEIDAMTGGRRMDRVMRRVGEALGDITTRTGRKAGAWKAAFDTCDALEAELTEVNAQVEALEAALSARKQAEAAVKRLENPEAKARRDAALTAAQAALDTARAHVGAVSAARQDRDLAALKAASAQSDLDTFLAAIAALDTAQQRTVATAELATDATSEALRLKGSLATAQAHHASAIAAVADARKQLDAAHRQTAARKARDQAAQLGQQITKAETALGNRDVARARLKASGATPDWLRRVEQADGEVSKNAASVAAQASTLNITYEGVTRITRDGVAVPGDQPITLEGDVHLDLPGIGQMTLRAQVVGGDSSARLAAARDSLSALLAEQGAASVSEARALAAARAKAAADADLAQAILDTLAPDGIETLHSARADAELAAAEAHDDTLFDLADLERAVRTTEEAASSAQSALRSAEADHGDAREIAARQQAAAETAQQAHARAMADAGPEETRDARRAQHLRQQAEAQEGLRTAEAALAAVTAAAPDLDTATAEVKRANDAVEAARKERAQQGERLAALSSEIRTLAGHGIEERRDELQGQLDEARASEARLARRAAALTRLQTALDSERDAARDTYFGPVQQELIPLLSILHRDAQLSFDSDTLLPSGLTRGADSETLDDLSGGTREQIAILTRLAFARLFARQGRQMPIVLDDALVYSDDDRIIRMFTALTRVAQDQQIIVFSCRQLAFQDLGGTRPVVEIHDA